MTTEQWPEAIGLGPLYGRPTDLRPEEAERSPERRRMIQLAYSEAVHDDRAAFMAARRRRMDELHAMTKGGVIAELQRHIEAGRYATGQAAGPVRTWSKDDVINTVLWCEGLDPYDPEATRVYRDGADVLGVDQDERAGWAACLAEIDPETGATR